VIELTSFFQDHGRTAIPEMSLMHTPNNYLEIADLDIQTGRVIAVDGDQVVLGGSAIPTMKGSS
jgi:hypothetical protein